MILKGETIQEYMELCSEEEILRGFLGSHIKCWGLAGCGQCQPRHNTLLI
jgi:hypothetical protein